MIGKLKSLSARIVLYIILLIHSVIVVFPIYLIIVSSSKYNKEIFLNPYGFPAKFIFTNYTKLFVASNYHLYFRNSIVVTVSSIILILILSSFVAYVLAKYKFALNKTIYFYFLAGMVIPIKLGTINIVQIFSKLHLFDNLLSLIIIYTVMGIPLGVFILTAFIEEVPEELSNAARIDGCSEYGIFFRIVVPLIKPALSAVAIINILPIWNDFWFPLVLTRSDNLRTLPLVTAMFFGQFETQWGIIFAVLSVSSLPLIIFYLIISKQFIKGLSEGAFKGGF